MLVREYRESDLAQLRAIHAAQGFDYSLPDLSNPLFVTKLVLEKGDVSEQHNAAHDDAIIGAAFLRLTAEAYLLLDPPACNPRQPCHSLLALHPPTQPDP